MAIRNLRYEKDEILKKKSREVDIIDEKIQTLIDDMIETMYKYNGVGLSAVQVGILKRVVVIDIEDGTGVKVLINPKITKTKGEQEVEEGCLSFPNQYAKMIRPKEVTVEALDRNGKKITIKAKDLLAQAIVHECDHLDGIVFVDKMIPGTLEYVDPEKK
mgnify:FL=1